MIVNLSGEVGADMFNLLIKSINEAVKEGKKLTIYFSTQGGDVDSAESILELININKDIINIIFYGEVFSAGMMIFLKVECDKRILTDTRGMYHFAWQQMIISEGGSPTDEYDKFSMNEMKKSKLKTIEFLKTTKMTEKEIALVKKGKDVYFSHERMLELL